MASEKGPSFPGLATSVPLSPAHSLPGHSPHPPVLSPLLKHLELEPHSLAFPVVIWSPNSRQLLYAGAALSMWLIHSGHRERLPQEATFNNDSSCLLDSGCHWGSIEDGSESSPNLGVRGGVRKEGQCKEI